MVERAGQRKIAFVGTSRIGKTEIITQLQKKHPDAVFVPEAARIYFTEHPEIPQSERFSAKVQGQVQDLQWSLEREANNSGAVNIFCDRSVLDAVVYARADGDLEAEQLFTKVASWIATYHKILLLDPRDVPYEKDYIRQEDEAIRQKNHDEFVAFFKEKQIPYELLSGTIEQRLARIEQILQG